MSNGKYYTEDEHQAARQNAVELELCNEANKRLTAESEQLSTGVDMLQAEIAGYEEHQQTLLTEGRRSFKALQDIAMECDKKEHHGTETSFTRMIKDIALNAVSGTQQPASTRLVENRKIWGELYIDDEGKANLDCHIHSSVKFEEAEAALRKFIALFQDKIDRKDECPLHKEST